MPFKLISDFTPNGDQPQAIESLAKGLLAGDYAQILLGVTGSGKTFTIANVIEKVQRPVLVLSHNKTLAAQLYGEFKQFFPENAVEFFVSYYDYYQPEAYIPSTNTYIEKDLAINDEIEKLRLRTTSALLSGRRDVIVVSSVSCIYGIGNPKEFAKNTIHLRVGQEMDRDLFLKFLVGSLYARTTTEFVHGQFRVQGDTVDVFPAYADFGVRIIFWDNEIESIHRFDPISGEEFDEQEEISIYPASIFMTTQSTLNDAIKDIQLDLGKQVDFLKEHGKHLEAKRLEDRVSYDVEMLKELGYCSGIENYSRYFDKRKTGERPFCLLDYFPDDYIMVVDESHVTIPQIHAMYGGDRSRKLNLVEYGFRLPAALDNRPLKFEEFEQMFSQIIFVSATPADYELRKSEGVIVEQVIRPTGLLEPEVIIRPSLNQIDDLLHEINLRAKKQQRVLVTTLTKRMAEELNKYMLNLKIKCRYIHSEVETLERVKIIRGLRSGEFDVLIGVNLLREGLDLPEVSLVAILDADKEGFLRSERSLIQTAGRAARNIDAKVIMYADKITNSMQKMMDETSRRREKQLAYNQKHGITPQQISKKETNLLGQVISSEKEEESKHYNSPENLSVAADPVIQYMAKPQLEKLHKETIRKMEKAAKELDFISAAHYRDEAEAILELIQKN
ncbi:MAG TPA: excinuclease ABC subunit UvrB [Bacteroidetes bacterium]|nr:excinuclease ABC subunit UvrB [Bacteroidota bacterium]